MPTIEKKFTWMPAQPPQPAVVALIEAFRERWNQRFAGLSRRLGPTWRQYRVGVDAALRGEAEAFFPIAVYFRDLAKIGRAILPHPSWLPVCLRLRQAHLTPRPASTDMLSVFDLWRRLPPTLGEPPMPSLMAPHVFFCALADPARYGTAPKRYPAQRRRLAARLRQHGDRPRILDIGCGVGHGTLEIAATLQARGIDPAWIIGLTREPLEAWMAARRILPHDPRREAALRAFPATLPVAFLAGDALAFPFRQPADVIVCNGLIGGDVLHRPKQYERFLAACGRLLAPGGCLLLANRFHTGDQRRVEAFAARARAAGWSIRGHARDLELSPP